MSSDDSGKNSLAGIWTLVKGKWDEGQGIRVIQEDQYMQYKIYTSDTFIVVRVDKAYGEVVSTHGGSYEFDGNKLTEKIEFASQTAREVVDTTHVFNLELSEETYKQTGTEGPLTHLEEYWKKAK
jgi:hypothetical protein